MAYANGQLPSSAISLIPGTQQYIRSDLLPGVIALRAAFQRHFGKPLHVTDGYRSYASQERIFRQRYTTSYAASAKIDQRSWLGQTWWRRAGYASASTPGGSNHGWGQAIDFGSGVNSSLSSQEHRWMLANAPSYGWSHPAWARKSPYLEPWHWEGVVLVSNPGWNLPGGSINIPDTGTIEPIVEDFLSALNDNEQRRLLEAADMLRQHFMYVKGAVDDTRKHVTDTTARTQIIRAQGDNITNGVVSTLAIVRDLADREGVDVDEQALAAALAPLLVGLLNTLSNEDVERVARASTDLLAKRLGATPPAE